MLWATEFLIEFSTPNSKIALKIPCPSTVVLQPFLHQELVLWRQFFRGWGRGKSERDGSGSNVSHGEWWRAADEVSFTGSLLTSCYARQYWSAAWGLETPVLVYSFSLFNVMMTFIFLMTACMLSRFSCVWLCETPWTVACQASLSMGFSRQEYWSGLLFPFPGDLPDPGIKPKSLT